MTFTISEIMSKINFINNAIASLGRGDTVDRQDLINILDEYATLLLAVKCIIKENNNENSNCN